MQRHQQSLLQEYTVLRSVLPIPASWRLPAVPPALAGGSPVLDLQGLLGPEAWGRLPLAVQRRFAIACPQTRYQGHIDLQVSPMGRCFALCAKLLGAPLSGQRAHNMPTTVRVYHDAHGGMVWERAFHAAGGVHVVRSTKQSGPMGSVIERTDGGLSMELQVFEEDGSLVFQSRRYLFCLGRMRVRVPALLTPGQCRVEHRDLGHGLFRFSLDMTHPLWGRTFHQSGVFTDPHWSAA